MVDQSVISPTTTNELTSSGNTITSNVNGVSDDAAIINTNTLALNGNSLVSTVNSIATTPAVDLSKYLDNTDEQEITDFSVVGGNLSITIENGNTMTVPMSSINTDNQTITNLSLSGTTLSVTLERGNTQTVDLAALTNTTKLANGTNTTVTGTGTSTDQYRVNVATATATDLGVVKPGTGLSIANGTLSVNFPTDNNTTYSGSNSVILATGNIFQRAALTGDVTAALDSNATTVTAIRGVNVSTTSPTADQFLKYTGGSWTPSTIAASELSGKGILSVSEGIEFTGGTTGTDKLLANAGIGIANLGITEGKLANNSVSTNKIQSNAVTTDKILNGTVLAEDLNPNIAGDGLVLNTTNNRLDVKAESGVEIHDDKVKLGGNLTRSTTITQNGNPLTIATGGSNLNISCLDKTKVQATNATNGITDYLLAVGTDDKVKALKAAMPKFFYMPSVLVPTAESQLGQTGVTYSNATRTGTIQLYDIYVAQFGSPVMSSAGAAPLPVLPASELGFHITYATQGVFTINSITATGLMTYTVSAAADITSGSFINIVFSVNED